MDMGWSGSHAYWQAVAGVRKLPDYSTQQHSGYLNLRKNKPTIMPSHHSDPSNAVKTFKRHQWVSNSSRVQTTLENIHYSLRNASMFRYCCCGLFW